LFSFAFPCLPRRRLLITALLGGLALVCVSASSARAAGLIDTDACDNATLTQPFLPWGDSNSYKLVPGGDFEGSLTGWTLSGGAGKVAGSDGAPGKSVLNLPAGSSAQSPYTCADFAYPTFRFFVHNDNLLSTVAVSVVYNEPLVGPVAVPIGAALLAGKWQPSIPMLTLSAVQGVVDGLVTGNDPQVALRFTALTGTSQIDDVYVDPEKFW
jgi:hypothetical protein